MNEKQEEKILVAGSGGQGVMLLGKIIAQAAVLEDKKVTYLRSYGAAMRGGTANCWVKVSNKEIATPVFEKSTVSVILNNPSFEKFKTKSDSKGCLIVNSSVVNTDAFKKRGVFLKRIPLNSMATEVGNIKVANVIALGYLLKIKPFIKLSSVVSAMEKLFEKSKKTLDPKVLEQNKKALQGGYSYG